MYLILTQTKRLAWVLGLSWYHLSGFMVFLKSLETISELILYSEYLGERALDLICLGSRWGSGIHQLGPWAKHCISEPQFPYLQNGHNTYLTGLVTWENVCESITKCYNNVMVLLWPFSLCRHWWSLGRQWSPKSGVPILLINTFITRRNFFYDHRVHSFWFTDEDC